VETKAGKNRMEKTKERREEEKTMEVKKVAEE